MNAKALVSSITLIALFAVPRAAALEPAAGVAVDSVKLTGRIEGSSFSFGLALDATTDKADAALPLVAGDVVLEAVAAPQQGYRMGYDADGKTYTMRLADAAAHSVQATFAARARSIGQGAWRESTFALPSARLRSIEITCDRTDLEVQLPDALRVKRTVADDQLTITALLLPGKPFVVRWKPQVQELDAELVFASNANTIATVSVGALKVDTLFEFDISQGKMNQLSFTVPAAMSVTQVRGQFIRDWTLREPAGGGDGPRTLVVELNRPQTQRYGLQILSETPLQPFPLEVDVPVIEPNGGIRAGGHVAVGTNSAIQVVVKQTAGLTQINADAFPRVVLDREHGRPIPAAKSFFFSHATSPYRMSLSLADIVPAIEAEHFTAVRIGDDDLTIEGSISLTVRDAPIRDLTIDMPAGFSVAGVRGEQVEEVIEQPAQPGAALRPVVLRFKQPVIGPTQLAFKLDLGRPPLDAAHALQGILVRNATLKPSHLVIAAAPGVDVDVPQVQNMRSINTANTPQAVPGAQYAYSYREPDWSIQLTARRKPAGIRAELFHLTSIGQGVVYGNVAVNYFITGSPVDQLQLRVPAHLSPEWISKDIASVTRDADDPTLYTVRLTRKVIGDYHLGVTFRQDDKAEQLDIAAVSCVGDEVKTQIGYAAVSTHLQLDVRTVAVDGSELREIAPDEVPGNYKLLVSAPILKAYKYVKTPHAGRIEITRYQREDVLPIVIELTDIHTQVYADKDTGEAQSRTTMRYMVKNRDQQFLALRVPDDLDVTIWQTRVGSTVVSEDGELVHQLQRVNAARDGDKLLIPLPPSDKPNEPVTIEVELGKAHGELGFSGDIDLAAPATDPDNPAKSTYTKWMIEAPEDWAVWIDEADLSPEPRDVAHGDIAAMMTRLADAWTWAGQRWGDAFTEDDGNRAYGDKLDGAIITWTWLLVIAGLIAVVLCAVNLRRHLFDAVLATLLIGLLLFGVLALQAPQLSDGAMTPDVLDSATLTETVTTSANAAITVEARVVPAWRQYVSAFTGVVVPIVALVALIVAVVMPLKKTMRRHRKLRRVLIALGLTGLLIGAAQYPRLWPTVINLFTWLGPLLLLLYFTWRVIVRALLGWGPAPAVGAAAAAALALLLTPAPALAQNDDNGAVLRIAPRQPVLERVEAALTADEDSVEVAMSLKVNAPEAIRYELLPTTPILLTEPQPNAPIDVEREAGRYYLVIREPGQHELSLTFLSPLPKEDDQQGRRFTFPLPTALTNRVSLAIPATGLDVSSNTAMRLDKAEADGATTVSAILGPGDDIDIYWKPRTRQRSQEPTSFIAQVLTAVRFDSSLVEARHRVRFQIVKGELKDIHLTVPQPMTVTAVQAPNLGAWRFDPQTQQLEARLSEPVTGEYTLDVVTQISQAALPYETTVGTLTVRDASRQRSTIGLMTSDAVFLNIQQAPTKLNLDDFARDAADLLKSFPGYTDGALRFAYRLLQPDDAVTAQAIEVKPELRVVENAAFDVMEERLRLRDQLTLTVTKAGVFNVELQLPADYEIESLNAPQVSHYDDTVEGDVRTVTVHFRQKLLGQVVLNLDLTRTVASLPQQLAVPRVTVTNAAKHNGRIVLLSERGVRLREIDRAGLAEEKPAEHNLPASALVYSLRETDWTLTVETEVLEPRINVDFHHVAEVGEGVVHHTHRLGYVIQIAGVKVLDVEIPEGIVENSLVIQGGLIARREKIADNHHRIELTRKIFDDQPYQLTISYDTPFKLPDVPQDESAEQPATAIELAPVKALGAALQRGHIFVLSSRQVRIEPATLSSLLQSAEPREFKEPLSRATFCYFSPSPDYAVTLAARRHEDYALLQADVLRTALFTIVAETGRNATEVNMWLKVGNKQHLKTMLPEGADLWSLKVNDIAAAPARVTNDAGREILLIPLADAARGADTVQVQFIYVAPQPAGAKADRFRLLGPRFDLPLKDLNWSLYVPEHARYEDFEGAVTVDDESLKKIERVDFSDRVYVARTLRQLVQSDQLAERAQVEAEKRAGAGQMRAAQQLFKRAEHASAASSEDARVKLQQYNADWALVGLYGSRVRLQQQEAGLGEPSADLFENVSKDQIETVKRRVHANRADSENLTALARAWTETQEKAVASPVQLAVTLPFRGKVIRFQRSVQVKPNAAMELTFQQKPAAPPRGRPWLWSLALFAAILLFLFALPFAAVLWSRLRETIADRRNDFEDDDFDDFDDDDFNDADLMAAGSDDLDDDDAAMMDEDKDEEEEADARESSKSRKKKRKKRKE